MEKIRVFIVDDSIVIRKGLTDVFNSDPEIEVVGTAANGKVALARLPELKPDIITLDIEMPEMDGITTMKEIRKVDPLIPVVMFSSLTIRGAESTLEALSAGATDYFAKPSGSHSLENTNQMLKTEVIPKIKALGRRAPRFNVAFSTSEASQFRGGYQSAHANQPISYLSKPFDNQKTAQNNPSQMPQNSTQQYSNSTFQHQANTPPLGSYRVAQKNNLPQSFSNQRAPQQSSAQPLSTNQRAPIANHSPITTIASQQPITYSNNSISTNNSMQPIATPVTNRISTPGLPEILVIGVSTGGPNALAELLPMLPAKLSVPVLIVQHMPPIFTKLLAERLSTACNIPVVEATSGDIIKPGKIWLAPGDYHLKIVRDGAFIKTHLTQEPQENSCRPAVDVLFRSASEIYTNRVLAVIMTGMGQDGLKGAELIYHSGGQIIAQDENSSIVWGMPGAVCRAGLADKVLPLKQIAPEILKRISTIGRV